MNVEITESELNNLLMGDSSRTSKKSKKRKTLSPNLVKAKRLKTDDLSFAVKGASSPQKNSKEQNLLSDDKSNNEDPRVLEEIVKRIEHKNRCTLYLSGLPPTTKPQLIEQLIPDSHTARIQWNSISHQCSGHAYVELESAELVDEYKNRLDGMMFKDRTLVAKTGKFLPESADRYDCKTLVLRGFHHKTHIGEIARRFPASTSIKMPSAHRKWDRRRPTVAYLTFPTAQAALLAFDTRQNCVIRRRRINLTWFLQKSEEHNQPLPKKCLFVRGLKGSVTETDLQTVFPQATSVSIRPKTGEAFLYYDLEEDCLLDKENARHLKLFGRKLFVSFHQSTKVPPASSVVPVITASHVRGADHGLDKPTKELHKNPANIPNSSSRKIKAQRQSVSTVSRDRSVESPTVKNRIKPKRKSKNLQNKKVGVKTVAFEP